MNRNQKEIMVLCDSEEDYVSRLADYMNTKVGFPFEVYAFSDMQAAASFMDSREITLYLGPDIGAFTGGKSIHARQVLFFSETLGEDTDGEARVCKYQGADDLIRNVLEEYAKRNKESAPERPENSRNFFTAKETGEEPGAEGGANPEHTCIIGVCSPVGRCGKTEFAITLGEFLARRKETLYINLEDYRGLLPPGREEDETPDLIDLIYYLREDPGSIELRLAGMTKTLQRLDLILPADTPMDLSQVQSEEWGQLLDILAGSGKYAYLILDIGNRIEQILAILPKCSEIYLPAVDEEDAKQKIRHFMRTLSVAGLEDVKERISPVCLPQTALSGKSDPLRQLMKGEMGEYIRKLLRRQNRI